MKPPTLRTALFLAVDVALLLVCIGYLPALIGSARAPFEAISVDGHIQVDYINDRAASGGIAPGDRIAFWNGESVQALSDLDFFTFYRAPGDTVRITLEGGACIPVICITRYDLAYILIIIIVGVITWGLGVFVLVARPHELAAAALHWSLVCMGASTILTWGRLFPGDTGSYITRCVFLAVYLGVPSLFMFFTSIFPRPKPGPVWLKAAAAFVPVGILFVVLCATLFPAMQERSAAMFRTFQRWFNIFHVLLIVNVAVGLLSIIVSYRSAETRAERKKIEWILWGLAFGPTPFLFLVVLPELFGRRDIIPEQISIVFFLLIPASFAISFVKHHVLDIEVVIKRTTVYTVVLGVVIALYAIVVGSVSAIVGTFVPQSAAAAAVGVAILFEPVRKRVQHLVDRRFFRVQYDFRQTGRSILGEIEAALDESHLGEIVVRRLDSVIPVEQIALVGVETDNESVHILGAKGWEGARRVDRNSHRWPELHPGLPAGLDRVFEAGVPHTPMGPVGSPPLNIVAEFPMADENQRVLGWIALGPKKSGGRFSAEDVDLLMQVAAESGLALQRVRLQVRLLLEQIAARRLEELNRLKSDFVSYVSHELRTPLTSIKMFTEMLRSRRMKLGRTAREYLGVIEGESERLSRMVTTILDSARIEQGAKEYRLLPGDLRVQVSGALETMAYQLKQNRFAVRLILPRRPLMVLADPDAVTQAVVNLVANSIKYSGSEKRLTVRLGRRQGNVVCSVSDRGRGIPPDAIPRLFERFYRAPDVRRNIQGVGLGLPLVHHIMTAHRGSVEVESDVGKGSTFTLVFPAPAGAVPAGTEQGGKRA
ncbi:MAG TPA: ATP-binding protein [Bacteroidota bacterium]|nr:ATP-binding protein [Bacteroidota bacterium]